MREILGSAGFLTGLARLRAIATLSVCKWVGGLHPSGDDYVALLGPNR